MKFLVGVLLLSSMISSAFAAEVFSETFSCQDGKTLSLSLDIEKNVPAKTVTKEYCSFDERGETCDTAYAVDSAMTAIWRVTSTIPGFKSIAKRFPIDIMIFPMSGSNPIMLVTELGINVPEIKIAKDHYLSLLVGANFSYNAAAVLSEKNVLTDLVDLDQVHVGGGVIEYKKDGEFTTLCNF